MATNFIKMANLNQLVCANNVANTGFGNCFLDMKQIIGAFIVPNGFSLTAADLADIQIALTTDTKIAVKLNRLFPVGNFVSVNSGTEDKTTQTFSYGGKKVVKEGDYDWTFQFTEGGLCLHKALRSFNSNGSWSILFYDAEFRLFGTTGSVATSLYAIPTKVLWANPWTPNDGSNTAVYTLQTVFEPRFINEDLAYVAADSYLTDIVGLQDIILVKNSWVEATGVANVTATSRCGTNLYEVYPTEIADVLVWKASNAATGAVITVSSVAGVAATKTFNITVSTADPDFPAGTQGVYLDMETNAVLESKLIVGYESAGALTLPTTA